MEGYRRWAERRSRSDGPGWEALVPSGGEDGGECGRATSEHSVVTTDLVIGLLITEPQEALGAAPNGYCPVSAAEGWQWVRGAM